MGSYKPRWQQSLRQQQFAPSHSRSRPTRTKRAAFFDLDKTIIARSSAYAFHRKFRESGLISTSGMIELAFSQALYISQGHDSDQIEAARERMSALVKGWQPDVVRKIAEDSLHQVISPYVYAEARELINHHRRLGHDVYVVSASATELVEPIARAIGVNHTVATRIQVRDGVYTGEIEFFCRGDNKAAELQRLAELHGYDLSACYAYSDSITDEPMLAAVGFPMAVNPDKNLRALAQQRSWPIRDFHNPEPLFTPPRKRATVASAASIAAIAAAITFALRRR